MMSFPGWIRKLADWFVPAPPRDTHWEPECYLCNMGDDYYDYQLGFHRPYPEFLPKRTKT